MRELDAETRDVHEADLLIAPIVGLQMPLPRLQLPSGVRVVRADTVDAPIEAMRSEGMQRAAWEPQYLALAEQDEGAEGVSAALAQLHDLISVLRLYREGGIGLGPYAFAPVGEQSWRRIATGAAPTRPGGYQLSEDDSIEVRGFAHDLEVRPDPDGPLAWAVARFEIGCERPTPLEGLSDHLLALRAVLEGPGPVNAPLPTRAAALLPDGPDREDANFRIERAQRLERTLMSGGPLEPGGEDSTSALELATWVEGCTRSILRDGALGYFGDDLCAAADETLIADGLDAGEPADSPQMGGTAEWEAPWRGRRPRRPRLPISSRGVPGAGGFRGAGGAPARHRRDLGHPYLPGSGARAGRGAADRDPRADQRRGARDQGEHKAGANRG